MNTIKISEEINHPAPLRSFARTWSVDIKDRKLRVNVISPGTVITPGYKTELCMSDDQITQIKAQTAATTPLGRAGTTDEIAKGVVFLASEKQLHHGNGIVCGWRHVTSVGR